MGSDQDETEQGRPGAAAGIADRDGDGLPAAVAPPAPEGGDPRLRAAVAEERRLREELLRMGDHQMQASGRAIEALERRAAAAEARLAASEDAAAQAQRDLASAQALLAAMRAELTAVEGSRWWRATLPFRRVEEVVVLVAAWVRRRQVKRRSDVRSLVAWNLEGPRLRRHRLYGHGWCVGLAAPVESVALSVRSGWRRAAVPVVYGLPDPDAARAHPDAEGSAAAGFVLSGAVPFPPRSATLHVRLQGFGRLDLPVAREVAVDEAPDPVGRLRALVRLLVPRRPVRGLPHAEIFAAGPGAGAAGPTMLIFDGDPAGPGAPYRKERLATLGGRGESAWLLSYDRHALSYRCDVVRGERVEGAEFGSLVDVLQLWERARPAEILVNSLFSFEDPPGLLRCALALRARTGATLTVAVHDYFAVCPSHRLLHASGSFCGIPRDLRVCRSCLGSHAGSFTRVVPGLGVEAWRAAWGPALAAADRVLCFSESSVRLVRQAYPDLPPERCEVQAARPGPAPRRSVAIDWTGGMRIGLVGQLSAETCGGVVRQLVDLASAPGADFTVTVVGTYDADGPALVSNRFSVTGAFERAELADMLRVCKINVCLVPSVYPETHPYASLELIALGMPVAVFDVGAQADAVRGYGLGSVVQEVSGRAALGALRALYARRGVPA